MWTLPSYLSNLLGPKPYEGQAGFGGSSSVYGDPDSIYDEPTPYKGIRKDGNQKKKEKTPKKVRFDWIPPNTSNELVSLNHVFI